MKFSDWRRRARAALAGAFLLAAPAVPHASISSDLIVSDERTGVALYGFDPVSYFLADAPKMGAASIELIFAGFAWRFESEANRAAFRQSPDVYVPRFGGYDPVALQRGAPVAGHPSIFTIHEGRLYLFQKDEHRAAFLAAPADTIAAAQANWPRVRRSLVH